MGRVTEALERIDLLPSRDDTEFELPSEDMSKTSQTLHRTTRPAKGELLSDFDTLHGKVWVPEADPNL